MYPPAGRFIYCDKALLIDWLIKNNEHKSRQLWRAVGERWPSS